MGRKKKMEQKKLPLGTIYQTKDGGNFYLRYQIQGKRKNVNLNTSNYDEALKEYERLLPTLQATTVEVVAAHVKNARQLAGRIMHLTLGDAWEKYSASPDRAMPATVSEQQAYQITFREFADFIGDPLREIHTITYKDALGFTEHMKKKGGYAVDTHNRKVKRLRKVFNVLKDYCNGNENPFVSKTLLRKAREEQDIGVPRNATKFAKKTSDKKETVPNANYLWIGYFATALNQTGKAALVMANSASDAGKSEYEIRKKMIEEGIISQMVTLPSNMFSSVTLPATLWFFDKNKPQTDKKDEILFIDARNTFTQVDRAHRKFSDEQIKNLGIITRLYHGDTAAFAALIAEYKAAFAAAPKEAADKETKTKAYWQEQIDWLNEHFPDGKYRDVIGLCKAAKLDGEDGIIDQDYSLNAGRYVGVVIEDDGMTEAEFKETMLDLNAEFESLNDEARKLEAQIADNIKALFGGRV